MQNKYQIAKKLKHGEPLTRKQAKALKQSEEAKKNDKEKVAQKLGTIPQGKFMPLAEFKQVWGNI